MSTALTNIQMYSLYLEGLHVLKATPLGRAAITAKHCHQLELGPRGTTSSTADGISLQDIHIRY